MNKFLIKIIIVIIIGSLTGVSLFYFWKNKFAFSKNEVMVEKEPDNKIKKKDLQNEENDKKISDTRAVTINYLEKNINKISPEKSTSGLAWHSVKIWFIDDNNFYVDYKDELSSARRVLIFRSNDGLAAEYEVLGFFVPGENGWILKSGKDMEGVTTLKLYERNEETGEWTVK